MKRFFKVLGIFIAATAACLYVAFLFVLPRVVDLEQYKPMVQKLAKDEARLKVDFKDLKISTTPLLELGIKAKDISVKLPDESILFSADSIKTRISLPSLLLLTVRVSTAEVVAPRLNFDIADSKQFKVVKLIEDIVNSKKTDLSKVEMPSEPLPFDPSIIKIVVPAFTLKDYKVAVNDDKASHNLILHGDKLIVGYFNGHVAKLKTDAKLLLDGKTNITANLDINTFIPTFPPSIDADDDKAQRLEIPFVNPIDIYRTYNLKTDVNAKLKIRMRDEKLSIKGFTNVENATMTLSGYKLPECYLKYKFYGNSIEMNNNVYVTPNEHIQLAGKVAFGKKPLMNLRILTQKIQFNNVIILTKAVLDTLQIPNNLASIQGQGYFLADADVKTDFKTLKSGGSLIVRDGGISSPLAGLFIKDTNVNIILDNNTLNIKDTSSNINGALLKAEGKINEESEAKFYASTSDLPLKGLYAAFAPSEIRNQFALDSGLLSFNASLRGNPDNAESYIYADLDEFSFADNANTFNISNEKLNIYAKTDFKTPSCMVKNKDFRFTLPSTNSVIYMPLLAVMLDEKDATIFRSGLKVNNNSIINFGGSITNYLKNPDIDFSADGSVEASDLKILAGKDAEPFLDAKGSMPLRVSINGTMKKLGLIAQVMTDGSNYFTPVTFKQLAGRQNLLQARADYKGNRIKIKDTGLYTKKSPSLFGNDLAANMKDTQPAAEISGTITNLQEIPYINLFTASIPRDLDGSLYALKNSAFKVDRTRIFAYGSTENPRIKGRFNVTDIALPELFLTLKSLNAEINSRNLLFKIENLLVNGSDFRINGNISLKALPMLSISDLNILSNNIDVNKLLAVSEAAAKFAPAPSNTKTASQPADLPVIINSGTINFRRIEAPPITANSTTGRIALRNNVFYLNNLRTAAIGGRVRGQINMNLANSILDLKVHGENFDVEKSLLVLANMKDAISGNASFDTDITIDAAATNQMEQMKSIKGSVDFRITDGQLGPFGKIENLILAENIRESKFFQTTIGSVINSITTIESSHFNVLDGHIELNDGIVGIKPITTIGKVLCIHIAGTMNLLTNEADMKLRARMGSQFSDMLGPLAALNPINLIKVTPGLNVMAAQAFQFFCEQISLEEMNALPDFDKEFSSMSTTKFQVVLRGNVEKPLSLVKSFKWLALDTDIATAQNFVTSLPDPSLVADPEHATYEQIMQAKVEQEALQAKEDAKIKNRLIRFFKREKSKTETIRTPQNVFPLVQTEPAQ